MRIDAREVGGQWVACLFDKFGQAILSANGNSRQEAEDLLEEGAIKAVQSVHGLSFPIAPSIHKTAT